VQTNQQWTEPFHDLLNHDHQNSIISWVRYCPRLGQLKAIQYYARRKRCTKSITNLQDIGCFMDTGISVVFFKVDHLLKYMQKEIGLFDEYVGSFIYG
jgi:hypothetical protein